MFGEVVGELGSGVETWVDDGSGSMTSYDVVYDRKVCATENKCVVCIGAGEMFCDDIFDGSCGTVWVFDGCDEVIGGNIGYVACEVVSSEEIFVDA